MKKFLTIAAISLLSYSSCFSAPPKWVDAGTELLEAPSARTSYYDLEKNATLHDAALLEEAKTVMTQIAPHIQAVHSDSFAALKTKMLELETAEQFSAVMFGGLHVHLADMVTPAGPRAISKKSFLEAVKTIFATETPGDNIMTTAHATYMQFFQDMHIYPFTAMTPADGEVGLKPLLQSLLSGQAPYFLIPESLKEGVHGGMIQSPIDFLLHDIEHALLIQELFFQNPILSPLREPLLARVKSLSGDSAEEQRELVQLFFFVHELSADWALFSGKLSFETPQDYMSNTLESLQRFAAATDDDIIQTLMLGALSAQVGKCSGKMHENLIQKDTAKKWRYPLPFGQEVTLADGDTAIFAEDSFLTIEQSENLEEPARFNITTKWSAVKGQEEHVHRHRDGVPLPQSLRTNLQDIAKVLALVHVDVAKAEDGTFKTQDIIAKMTGFMKDFKIPEAEAVVAPEPEVV